jgi:signal transduction histidine kinase
VGLTLGWGEGFPHLSQAAFAYTVRRAALSGIAFAAFIAGISAAAAAAEGLALAGATTENPGGIVLKVSPTGFAWKDGIRPGQLVVATDDTYAPTGWRLETLDSTGRHVSREQPFDDALRASWPFGLGAVLAGALAVVFVRTHRRWVGAFGAVALSLAAMPLQVQGDPTVSTAVLGAAAIMPLVWLARTVHRKVLGATVAVVGIGLVGIWARSRLAGTVDLDLLEPARFAMANYGTALLALVTIVGPMARGEGMHLMRPRLNDLIVVAVIGAVTTMLILMLHVSPFALVLGLPLLAFALPAIRRLAARRVEDVLFADVRAHVALEASEAERARLARELHDVPLQHLSSVIRHLEAVPDAADQTQQLREIAAQLRETTTGLRPPVLDDLGLAAALEFLATDSTSSDLSVVTEVSERSASGALARPPSDVEMGVFRIAEEAVNNAVRHSAARTITIRGEVAADSIQIVVRDDGSGLTIGREREAVKAGRLGMASMRRRAEAIDADLTIDRNGPGTSVAVRWQA